MKGVLVLLALMLATPAAADIVSGKAQIVDGDTLEVEGRRIRLFGIDAPELSQTCERDGEAWACGAESARQLAAVIEAQQVACVGDEIDQYGRLVATCSAGATEINAVMVETGWATAYRSYSQAYVAAETRARGNRRGLWRSTFDLPEAYRLLQAEAVAPQQAQPASMRAAGSSPRPSGTCLIKGNRNNRGEWIYHLPGRPYYDQTRPEEMFCTEEEAIAAGYRRSKA